MPNPNDKVPLIIPQGRSTALIITNLQNDHIDDKNKGIIPVINILRQSLRYTHTIFINHNHLSKHISFIDKYCDKEAVKAGYIINIKGKQYTLQEPHCVNGTRGQEIHPEVEKRDEDIVINIGEDEEEGTSKT